MAKNLKLIFKNIQLSEALSEKEKKPHKKVTEESIEEKQVVPHKKETTKKAASTKKKALSAKEPEEEAPKKRRVRVIPEEEVQPVEVKPVEEPKKEEIPLPQITKLDEEKPAPPPETSTHYAKVIKRKEEEKVDTSKPSAKEITPSAPSTPALKVVEEKTAPEVKPPEKEKIKVTEELAPVKKVNEVLEEEIKPRKEGFKELKGQKKGEVERFDSRARMGLRAAEEERWRKRRAFRKAKSAVEEIPVVRPSELKIKLPITIKDLAAEMKLKASEIISKFFAQGITLTLNDLLNDETLIQLIGAEFGCAITIDTSEAERLRITSNTIKDEIQETPSEFLQSRPPVITFMGHVDHGKTSLIDAIRHSNMAALEAGAITQHIGAFNAKTTFGLITILDTPGHEAFSEMRARGADVTDIVVLVVAGDEGILQQTEEAIEQAKAANVQIVVAINKMDKAGFEPEKVYRQLADHDLLIEAWGGKTITVNCSALTKMGINELLEMLALQAEVLELKANPTARARGTILESEMHKGLGATATVIIQNGTLKVGDAIVLGDEYGRIKSLYDQFGHAILQAGPSMPAKITGISGVAKAGCEFVVVKNEKEAKELAEARIIEGVKKKIQQPKKSVSDYLQEKKETQAQKILPVILKADVQGSLEALKNSLLKIPSDKIKLNIVSSEVGEISESDMQLAATSKAPIIGFHTRVESHAEDLIKQLKITVRLHDIIYHAVDDVKTLMVAQLDKIPQENVIGTALVKALFKSSQTGTIAGCVVSDGIIKRSCHVKVMRENNVIWQGKIASLKRLKDDVKEVQKGAECGIVLDHFSDILGGDKLIAFEITYFEQTL